MQRLGTKTNKYIAIVISLVMTTALFIGAVPFVYAANSYLADRYDQMSNSTASATTTHIIGFRVTNPATIGSIVLQFCDNSPILGDPCTAPTGLDVSSVALAAQNGEGGFTIHASSTSNKIVLTRVPAAPNGSPSSYQFNGVVNPSSNGTFYLRMSTYGSIDGSGSAIQEGGTALAIVAGLSVAAEVPPWLKFCVSVTISGVDCTTATSYLIDAGEFSTTRTTKAAWEFVVGSNANFGFSVTMYGTTLTSGNNVIPALTTQTASQTGTSQFGLNLRANSNPSIGAEPTGPGTGGSIKPAYSVPNQYLFNNGDVVVSSPGVDDLQKFTTSFVTNISKTQPAGVYTTTISYICLANF